MKRPFNQLTRMRDAAELARQIMDKVQAVAIRNAVKRLDEIGHGSFDEELKVWRGF